MNIHWYLVGQRAGARIFEQQGIKQELRLVRRFDNQDGRLKTSELVSDKQGRSDSGSMVGHNAVGDDNSPREHVLEKFVQELGAFLEIEAERSAFTSLVIVAEPHVLGALKKSVGKKTSHLMLETVSKDFGHISDHDMAEHLSGVLCLREAI